MGHKRVSAILIYVCFSVIFFVAVPISVFAEDATSPISVFAEDADPLISIFAEDATSPISVFEEYAEPLISIFAEDAASPISVCAEDTAPPHLIQTVSEQDIYESMLALGLLESKVLPTGDSEKAYENVKACVVSVNMGNAHGSGVIWEMTSEQTIIVTNKHVLEYWDEQTSYVGFPQGYVVDAKVLGTSDEHDVGFLVMENDQFSYEELEKLRYVRKDMDAFQALESGDEMFCMGAESSASSHDKPTNSDGESYYIGSIGDMNRYIDEFGEYMIYGLGFAKPGMSGGGTFDAKGNFIGMISGGTGADETASVPLDVIIEEYDKVVGETAKEGL
ncbi:MAG: trypsin-like peptidase domain-containing protein [Lachnospiraceae bacterium]|nr:trypsin-like peptidase domain-containing protein [Lachnospiraceae bacterium]